MPVKSSPSLVTHRVVNVPGSHWSYVQVRRYVAAALADGRVVWKATALEGRRCRSARVAWSSAGLDGAPKLGSLHLRAVNGGAS